MYDLFLYPVIPSFYFAIFFLHHVSGYTPPHSHFAWHNFYLPVLEGGRGVGFYF
jgi:hypothetical protein